VTDGTPFDIDAYLTAFQQGDTATMGQFLADNFGFTGPAPEPLPAAAFLGLVTTFFTAFPDIDWQLETSDVSTDGFVVTTRTSGTHTGVLDLTPLVGARYEPSGDAFQLPRQEFAYEIESELVTQITARPADGTGLPGILAQLGLG
jgi:predicted ester cyclase